MPAHRMNMRMTKDVLRLKFDAGFSHDRIAASLGISKGVVTKYVGLAGAAGLDWASACDMDEGELERRLLGKPTGPAAYAQPDYGRIHQELRRKGATLTLLWKECQAEFANRQTYRYTQFCEHIQRTARHTAEPVKTVDVTLQQRIEPHVGNEFNRGRTAITESGHECEQIRSLAPAELDPVDLHLIACSSLESHQRIGRRYRHQCGNEITHDSPSAIESLRLNLTPWNCRWNPVRCR